MKEDVMPKKPSFGNAVRKRLSDITNSQRGPKSPNKEENPIPVSTKDYIEQLHKENMMLVRLVAERNKIIELTGAELAKMRVNLQKVQQQNWQIAQSNSRMLAELNINKDKLKALQHELGCKVALLSAKESELQEKTKKKPCQKTRIDEQSKDVKGEAFLENGTDKKNSIAYRRHQSRSLSLGSSTGREQLASKESNDKSLGLQKQSVHIKSELDHTDGKGDNKRLCLRRQSGRFTSKQQEPTEDLFELEDAKFPVLPLQDDSIQGNGASSTIEEDKGVSDSTSRCETPALRRSSIGRPTRKVTEKIQSYKELPVNVKMRRAE